MRHGRSVVADITRERDLEQLFTNVGPVDHVVTTAADASGAYQPIGSLDADIGRNFVAAKLIGPALGAKHAHIAPGGSFITGTVLHVDGGHRLT
ncbi:hypothetical protein ACFQZZ_07085 [Nocardia sp. GCM10030253]|uniref:hypothetical protein n=1 Tax=Nocardia sp. GCM10030253 TaxID=3273404 RepID=UPI003627ACBC